VVLRWVCRAAVTKSRDTCPTYLTCLLRVPEDEASREGGRLLELEDQVVNGKCGIPPGK